MIIAKVTGVITSSQKDSNLIGKKMLLCREVDHTKKELKTYHVAVDAVQAGEGDIVLISYGSSARMTETTKSAPIDAVIIAILDDLQITYNPK